MARPRAEAGLPTEPPSFFPWPSDAEWLAWAIKDFQHQVELFQRTLENARNWGWFPMVMPMEGEVERTEAEGPP